MTYVNIPLWPGYMLGTAGALVAIGGWSFPYIMAGAILWGLGLAWGMSAIEVNREFRC